MVKNEFREYNYEVTPRVVLADKKSKIRISSIGRNFAFDDEEYILNFIPMEITSKTVVLTSHSETMKRWNFGIYDEQIAKPVNGYLEFEYLFYGEQEWIVLVLAKANKNPALYFHMYSLKEDLYERLPFIGDLHTHSCHSPDAKTESGNLAAEYRKIGFDFMALTDHERYYPSVELANIYKDSNTDFVFFLGEEVHLLPEINAVHIINIGGKESINELYNTDPQKYRKEIEEYAQTLDIPEGLNKFECALRCWTSDRIRECGGISVIAHPRWRWINEYSMRAEMVEWLMANNKYDAMELVSGLPIEDNNVQIALYNEMRANGIKVPIIGVSDCHGMDQQFNWGKTLAFIKDELNVDSLRESVLNLYSVAIGYEGETPRVYGPYRLVKYAQFLLKYYFPTHDELCVEEGIAMKNYFLGVEGAAEELKRLKGRTLEYAKRFMR